MSNANNTVKAVFENDVKAAAKTEIIEATREYYKSQMVDAVRTVASLEEQLKRAQANLLEGKKKLDAIQLELDEKIQQFLNV